MDPNAVEAQFEEAGRSHLDRRQFLELSLASATLLLATGRARAAAAVPAIATHGALTELAPGAVEPQGWLRVFLGKQAPELGSQLPNVSWPFTAGYWNGLEQLCGDRHMMWNARMLAATGEARFTDVIERALYNGINSGMSLDGRMYCYRNPLAFEPETGDVIRNP